MDQMIYNNIYNLFLSLPLRDKIDFVAWLAKEHKGIVSFAGLSEPEKRIWANLHGEIGKEYFGKDESCIKK